MKTQVLKMTHGGIWTVIFDDEAKYNPYKIYRTTKELNPCGYGLTTHKKKMDEYAEFYSCLCYLKDKVEIGFIHGLR